MKWKKQFLVETKEIQLQLSENDWLCEKCKTINKDFEELRQTCWSCLIILEEKELNKNVLEAIKVGQVSYF